MILLKKMFIWAFGWLFKKKEEPKNPTNKHLEKIFIQEIKQENQLTTESIKREQDEVAFRVENVKENQERIGLDIKELSIKMRKLTIEANKVRLRITKTELKFIKFEIKNSNLKQTVNPCNIEGIIGHERFFSVAHLDEVANHLFYNHTQPISENAATCKSLLKKINKIKQEYESEQFSEMYKEIQKIKEKLEKLESYWDELLEDCNTKMLYLNSLFLQKINHEQRHFTKRH